MPQVESTLSLELKNMLLKNAGKFSLKASPQNELAETFEVFFTDGEIPEVVEAIKGINSIIEVTCNTCLDAACKQFQDYIGVAGDVGGIVFSDVAEITKIRNSLLNYFKMELIYLNLEVEY